jgi:predicted ATP-dependent endonuclease of OLD family
MGHGLQRSYLLALLQELAASDLPNAPTLLLGCEEPELYQHPPQARHLSDVLQELTNGNNQVLVTTHSPFFVSGKGFENTRVVQGGSMQTGSKVKSLTYANLADRIRVAKDEQANKPIEGLISKIHQALQPGISEMFFSRVPILVEGLEDVAYITTEMHLAGLWSEFRQLGCHLIPVNGKDKLIQPLAIAMEFRIPVFVVFDADSDAENKYLPMHLKDNQVLIKLLDVSYEAFPAEDIILNNHAIWHTNLTAVVKADFGEYYSQLADIVRVRYPGEKRLEKHGLFIADLLAEGREKGHSSAALGLLCETILKFARSL